MFFHDLETDRLILENISAEDRDFIFNHFSDAVVNRYLFDAEPVTDITGAEEIIRLYIQPEPRLQHRWIIIRKTDGMKMGTCGFHCWNLEERKVDVGYDLQEAYRGKGYMQEALKEIISFAKDQMGIKEIIACISVDNQKSIHLAEKLGFAISSSYYELFRGEKYLHNRYSLFLDI